MSQYLVKRVDKLRRELDLLDCLSQEEEEKEEEEGEEEEEEQGDRDKEEEESPPPPPQYLQLQGATPLTTYNSTEEKRVCMFV